MFDRRYYVPFSEAYITKFTQAETTVSTDPNVLADNK